MPNFSLYKIVKVEDFDELIDIRDNIDINSIVFNDGLYLNGIKDSDNIIYEISPYEDIEIDSVLQDIINSLINLIDKVSMSENSIANIISTEADKVKKVINSTDDVDKILEVNESILSIISEAVSLEQYERSNLNDIIRLVEELIKKIETSK